MFVCRLYLVFLFLGVTTAVRSQEIPGFTIKDLSNDWVFVKDNKWQPWKGQTTQAIYLSKPVSFYEGKFLQIRSSSEIDLFLNNELIVQKKGGTLILSADSLTRLYPAGFTIGVFQPGGIDLISAALLLPVHNPASDDVTLMRPKNYFLNFSILVALILTGAFILLFRTNPRLTLDYLNVQRLFSIQEREDALLTTRVTASVNLLFYLFCSGCFGFALLTIFHLGIDDIQIARYFPIGSIGGGFLQWLKLTMIIAGCLALKLVLIYSFSNLFRMRETAPLQFFNFIRTIFLNTILISFISLGYFVVFGHPTGPHVGLLKMSMIVMTFSVIMIFLKLMSSASFSFFHLFSYLCASEIIPLVILLKVLLY